MAGNGRRLICGKTWKRTDVFIYWQLGKTGAKVRGQFCNRFTKKIGSTGPLLSSRAFRGLRSLRRVEKVKLY